MRCSLRFIITIFVMIGCSVGQANRSDWLDEPAIKVIFNRPATLYSEPGWTFKRYLNEKANKPKRLDFAQKGVSAYIIEDIVEEQNGLPIQFHKVIYSDPKTGESHTGWIEGSAVDQDYEALNQPSIKVRQLLGLGADPNIAFKRSTETEGEYCGANCDEKPIGSLGNIGEYIDMVAPLKSSEDLEWYLNMYRKNCSSKYHTAYVTEYQEYIQEASAIFGVPEALLTCLLFRESQFDKDAESFSSVKGIAQITGASVSQINGIIMKNEMTPTRLKKYKKILDCGPDFSSWDFECRKNGWVSTEKARQDNYEYVSSVMAMRPLGERWSKYFEKMESLPNYKKQYVNNPARYTNYQTPSRFSVEKGNQFPAHAIGASALYLKSILEGMEAKLSKKMSPQQAKDVLVITSAAYNAGPGEVNKRTSGEDPSLWREQIVDSYRKEQESVSKDYTRAKDNYNFVKNSQLKKARIFLKGPKLSEKDKARGENHLKDLEAKMAGYRKQMTNYSRVMNKADEVDSHMESISNCMKKDSDKMPSGTKSACPMLEIDK